MKYIFFLGRIPALSIAEIQAILEKHKIKRDASIIDSQFFVIETGDKIDFEELLVQMGGTIKISEIIGEYSNHNNVLENIAATIEKLNEKKYGKKNIGYSLYFTGKEDKNKAFQIAQEMEKGFAKIKNETFKKTRIRIIYPQKNFKLNSASVVGNKMINRGAEFNLIFSDSKVTLSKTISIQDIENYSMRDYERPRREARIGMIPPKLAQIMINLAQIKKSQVILDPFCGIGTILQEALLNDYKVIGSDANDKQIQNCENNLKWLSTKYILEYPDYKIFQSDIGNILKKIKPNSIDAIVTESTLGPAYKKAPTKEEMKQNYNRLEKIYMRFFQIAKFALRKKARMIVTLPVYKIKQNQYAFAPFVDKLEKIGYSVICPIDKKFINKYVKVTSRNSIIYDRPDQIVAREIMIFENR